MKNFWINAFIAVFCLSLASAPKPASSAQRAQTISFTSTPPVAGDSPYTVTATATSGLAVAFTTDVSASTLCTIAGATVSFIGTGTCKINANEAGNVTYDDAAQVQQSFMVDRGAQTNRVVSPTSARTMASILFLLLLDVNPANQAPAITSANATTFHRGQTNTFTVTTTGFPTATSMVLSEAGALPSAVTFTDNHDGTATIAGTASGAALGPYPLTITANNGVAPNATQNFTLTVIQGTTVSYTGPAVPIPDNTAAGVNVNLPVSGVGTITDLNFRFDTGGACDATVGNTNAAVDHTFIGDLTFKLTSPGATTVTFQARRGGTRENICLTNINDEGGFPNVSTLTSVTGSPQAGNFSPETTGVLNAFDGQNANGTWVLNVSDNASLDTGSVRRFSLIFNSGN